MLFVVRFTHAQGAGGGGGGGGGGGSGGGGFNGWSGSGGSSSWNSHLSDYGTGNCIGEQCQRRTIIIVCSVIGGVLVLPIIIIVCYFFCTNPRDTCDFCRHIAGSCGRGVVDCCHHGCVDCCHLILACDYCELGLCKSKVTVTTPNPSPRTTESPTVDQKIVSVSRLKLRPISRHKLSPISCSKTGRVSRAKLPPIPNSEFSSTSHTELSFISSTKLPSILHSQTSTTNVFQSGCYNMCYYQYFKWHGPFLAQFEFNERIIRGNGSDDVGSFDITGSYSTDDNRMTLTKHYKRGTGDPRENLGHQVKIDLKWNEQEQQFDGQWIIRTTNYSGQDKFELKLKQHLEPTL
ncbi:unnamed protein product [Rotaria sp. Silwood2]|nr:unnamed protein product [Rotaria sp. Silwood2]